MSREPAFFAPLSERKQRVMASLERRAIAPPPAGLLPWAAPRFSWLADPEIADPEVGFLPLGGYTPLLLSLDGPRAALFEGEMEIVDILTAFAHRGLCVKSLLACFDFAKSRFPRPLSARRLPCVEAGPVWIALRPSGSHPHLFSAAHKTLPLAYAPEAARMGSERLNRELPAPHPERRFWPPSDVEEMGLAFGAFVIAAGARQGLAWRQDDLLREVGAKAAARFEASRIAEALASPGAPSSFSFRL